MSDSLPLTCRRELTCELNVGAFLHCKALEGSLRALGLWYCESYGITANIKAKTDPQQKRDFSWEYLELPRRAFYLVY